MVLKSTRALQAEEASRSQNDAHPRSHNHYIRYSGRMDGDKDCSGGLILTGGQSAARKEISMLYKANKNSLEDETGKQILVMLPTCCSRKRAIEICKITANILNNIERGKQSARKGI